MFSDAEVSVFLDELDEKIQVLNDNFLLLEREGDNLQVLQEIFRAAHTIKGSSAIMGYTGMSQLTHEMENLFDKLRQGQLHASNNMIDVLFESLDGLKALRDHITGQGPPVDTEVLVRKLKEFLKRNGESSANDTPAAAPEDPPNGENALGFTEAEEDVIREAQIRGFQAYWISVTVDSECQMKFVRAFLVFETLQKYGEIIKSVPPAEAIQEGEYDAAFQLLFLSQEDTGRIRHLLLTIAEIVDVSVEPVVLGEEQLKVSLEIEPRRVRHEAVEVVERQESSAQQKGDEDSRRQVKTVRIDVQKLDNLMNLVGELVIDRTRLDKFTEVFENRYDSSDLVESLNEISNHLGQLTNDLQEHIMKARMLPIAHVFNRFPRMVRDLAHKLNKEIDFIVEGKGTELDRNVIELISDPLIHLLRNAVGHGVESPEDREAAGKPRKGAIRLKAFHQEGHIIITIEDDGQGLDVKKIRLMAIERGLIDAETAARISEQEVLNFIFMPGFSLARQVTDLSGRGVGMDVVRRQIEQINGTVEMHTVPGQGTKFSIKLPLTLAIIRALMVSSNGQLYAFPLTNVMETIYVSKDEVQRISGSEVIIVRGQVLPIVSLAEAFGEVKIDTQRMFMVIVGLGNQRLGVSVEQLLGEQEIVIKSLGRYLGRIPCISGATILGDGKVALIVDVRGLIQELTKGVAVDEAGYAAG
ncbi:MAG: chemotaxis protein CheA [Ammonifex sp.]|nr:MAG: chemotaxis protein CheA [Ammonifex sp.]